VRVALNLGPLAPRCPAALTVISLDWHSDGNFNPSFETLGLHCATTLPDQPALPDHLETTDLSGLYQDDLPRPDAKGPLCA
jgi:hypothetical protein